MHWINPSVQIRQAYFLIYTKYILQRLPVHQNMLFVGLYPHPHNNQELQVPLLEGPLLQGNNRWE